MLHLDARVHFHKVELAIFVEQKFRRTKRDVADRLGQAQGGGADAVAQRWRQSWAWRLLDQLLMAALNRAVAFAEVSIIAVFIGDDLDLDVAWLGTVAFDKTVGIAKAAQGLGLSQLELPHQLMGRRDNLHTATTTTGRCLDDQGITDLFGDLDRLILAADHALATGQHRHVGFQG